MPAAKSSATRKSKSVKSVSPFAAPDVFRASPVKAAVSIHLVRQSEYAAWLKTQSAPVKASLKAQGWAAGDNAIALTFDANGHYTGVYVGIPDPLSIYTLSVTAEAIQKKIPATELKKLNFAFAENSLSKAEITQACIGWALGCYQFDTYKSSKKVYPVLSLPKGADQTRITAMVEAVCMSRQLINLPANILGPEELAGAIKEVASKHKASIKITEDKKLLADNFPLIYGVGDGSDRRPRLVDFTWGNPKHPKVTFVGKGVCFDTGGLDLKPSSAMLNMKKDMAGAAMALGVAWLVMALKLPVRLRVLIPAVENSVSGRAYRPMDILPSRKGLSVEIGNTDAEGRLVMADCLTLACEEKPDLLIDFSALTGAARAAVGLDISAMFSNRDDIAQDLQALSFKHEDPVWQLPLYQPYKSDIMSPNADINNSGNNVAGAITAALFLESFVEPGIDWIHIDGSAWQSGSAPGRSRGGADMSVRSVFALLEERYAKKPRS
jgi:leucyl aminopeptidase